MELDDLKQLWQQQPTEQPADTAALQQMLLQRSKGPIARIRRNLNRELWAVLVTYILAIGFYVFADRARYWNVVLLLVCIAVLFILYYIKKRRLLKAMENVSGQVKNTMERQVQLLGKYVRFYFVSGTIGTPLTFFLALIMVKAGMPQGIVYSEFFTWPLGIGMLVLTVISYFLNKWYVNKLYGKHVEKLKQLISQLESD
jgi:hypothetical protein